VNPDEPGRGGDQELDQELPPPTGTLFLTMIYIMVLAGMWLSIYFEFIGR
jgi:hypothetical protein